MKGVFYMEKIDQHKKICGELNEIYTAKNKDYGDSFTKGFQEYGLTMPAIRLEDKLRRYKQLIKQDAEVKDESIIDTLLDLANYAIMTIIEIENRDGE
jgi:hypothetical protein